MRQSLINDFQTLQDMARDGAADPSTAAEYCRKSLPIFTRMSPEMKGLLPSSQWVRPASTPTITTASSQVISATPIAITFPRPGWVVGLSGTEAKDPNNASKLSFDLSIDNGTFHLCATANGPGFTSLAAISQASVLPRPYYPFRWYVTTNSKWFVTWATEDTQTPGTVLTPILMIAFESEDVPGAR